MRVMILAALVVTLAIPAHGQSQEKRWYMTGNDFHEACVSPTSTPKAIALGYAVGVLDSLKASSSLNAYICVPSGVSMGQVVDVSCAYIAKHPESRHKEAASLIFYALVNAWPCQ